jgi:hypothetical protein
MIKLLSIFATFGLAAISARAASFNMTNVLNPNVSLVSYPTNVAGWGTGQPIDVRQFNSGDFFFRATPAGACSNANIIVTLISSAAPQVPIVTTNGGVNQITTNEWNDPISGNSSRLQINIPHYGPGDCTNAICWSTNLPSSFLAGANWVSVYSITNNSTNSGAFNSLTNVIAGISGKAVSPPSSAIY